MMLSSCSTPENVEYFQDLEDHRTIVPQNAQRITLQPQDQISVIVNARDPQVAMMFNPTELLAEPALDDFIADMRKEYDYIILDSPTIEIVTDADIINHLADSTIFILRAGLFERSLLPMVDRLYTQKKYVNMTMLLNGTDGGGHHGYKYGYQSDESSIDSY